jgi:hypothetical protein
MSKEKAHHNIIINLDKKKELHPLPGLFGGYFCAAQDPEIF